MADSDPFAEVRNRAKRQHLIGEEEGWADAQQEVIELYKTYTPAKDNTGRFADARKLKLAVFKKKVLEDYWPQWEETLAYNLAWLPAFQRLVVDEWYAPGTHDFDDLQVNPKWLLCVHLINFYDLSDTFDDGWKLLKPVMPQVIGRAKQTLTDFLIEGKHVPYRMGNMNDLEKKPIPLRTTNPSIGRLFVLSQEEKQVNNLRAVAYADLHGLRKTMSDQKASMNLLKEWDKAFKDPEANSTLIDKFGLDCGRRWPAFAKAVVQSTAIRSVPTDMLWGVGLKKAVSSSSFELEGLDEYETMGRADTMEEEDPRRVQGMSPDAETYEETIDEHWLRKYVRSVLRAYEPLFYPVYIPGNPFYFRNPGPPFSEYDHHQGESMLDENGKRRYKPHKGFLSMRAASRKQDEHAMDYEAPEPSDAATLKLAAAYVERIMDDESNFDKETFKATYEKLVTMVSRDANATKAAAKDGPLRTFSTFVMLDNWWHVRNLLAAMRQNQTTSKKAVVDLVSELERDLAISISLIRCAKDALPHLLVIEARLRGFWTDMTGHDHSLPIRLLFRELVLWVNATALNAIVTRSERASTEERKQRHDLIVSLSNDRQQSRILTALQRRWYKALHSYNPQCANPDCLRHLVDPASADLRTVRSVMSVGVRDARVGQKELRSFISQNRDFAYPCLYDILIIYA